MGKSLFCLEGNIGIGKSTFLNKLTEDDQLPFFNCIPEPVKEWKNISGHNILDFFYRDMSRWAFSFEHYALLSRINSIYSNFKNYGDVFISERSIFTNFFTFASICRENGNLCDLEWSIYKEWYLFLIENEVTMPSAFIYLRGSPSKCFQRMIKRSRIEEEHVLIDYIEKLHEKHEVWFSDIKQGKVTVRDVDIPFIVIDFDEDLEYFDDKWKKIIKSVKLFINDILLEGRVLCQ
jgi:deoxyadenosine/deoxycytidine kinase